MTIQSQLTARFDGTSHSSTPNRKPNTTPMPMPTGPCSSCSVSEPVEKMMLSTTPNRKMASTSLPLVDAMISV